jgi:hypothetical protein
MKRASRKTARERPRPVNEDDILPEYDFSQGRRNVYAARLASDTVMVVLEPDVARAFPDSVAVNEALRALAKIANRPPAKTRSKRLNDQGHR